MMTPPLLEPCPICEACDWMGERHAAGCPNARCPSRGGLWAIAWLVMRRNAWALSWLAVFAGLAFAGLTLLLYHLLGGFVR